MATPDVDLLELVAERVEDVAGPPTLRSRGMNQSRKSEGREGPYGAQKAAAEVADRRFPVCAVPPLDPLIRTDERDPPAARRPLAEVAEEEAEPGAKAVARLVADAQDDLLGDLLAGEAAPVEHRPDGDLDLRDLRRVERRMDNAVRVPPRADERRAGRCVRRERADRRVKRAQLPGRVQMQRAAERPRLHEGPLLPQGVADIGGGDPVHARRELKLRRRLYLCLDATELPHDVEEALGRRALGEEGAPEPARPHPLPRHGVRAHPQGGIAMVTRGGRA